MQKISGILSGSSRVTSVDMKEAFPVRPGTPGFGRPEGVSALRERGVPSADGLRRARDLQDELMVARSKEAEPAAVVAQVSEKFFARNQQDADSIASPAMDVAIGSPVLSEGLVVESVPAGFKEMNSEALRESVDTDVLYPKGSFIDTVA